MHGFTTLRDVAKEASYADLPHAIPKSARMKLYDHAHTEEDALQSILRSLDLEMYSWQLRSHGITSAQHFADLRSIDALPVSLPEPVKAKLLAHGRSLAILQAAKGRRNILASTSPQRDIPDHILDEQRKAEVKQPVLLDVLRRLALVEYQSMLF